MILYDRSSIITHALYIVYTPVSMIMLLIRVKDKAVLVR